MISWFCLRCMETYEGECPIDSLCHLCKEKANVGLVSENPNKAGGDNKPDVAIETCSGCGGLGTYDVGDPEEGVVEECPECDGAGVLE